MADRWDCVSGAAAEVACTTNAQRASLGSSIADQCGRGGLGVGLAHPQFLAWHSLVEYSALVAGEALALDAAVLAVVGILFICLGAYCFSRIEV